MKSFTEKPDIVTANAFLESGIYFWNSGIFTVNASACLESFEVHATELVAAATQCWDAREQRIDEDTLLKSELENLPPISIDCAILEEEVDIALIPFDGGWSDVGSLDILSKLTTNHAPDQGSDTILVETKNVFVHSTRLTIAGIGLEDLIIIDYGNATLTVRKGQAEHVKAVIDQMKAANKAVASEHSFEYRP